MPETVPFLYWREWWNSASTYTVALCSGAVAGFCCEISLFPLDTCKTRLQSAIGFKPAGGFNGVYRGVGVALLGSVPCSALFFVSYEACIPVFDKAVTSTMVSNGVDPGNYPNVKHSVVQSTSAAFGEGVAATIRAPVEMLKQHRQVGRPHLGSGGLWRGWAATLLRDLPFSMIQYPTYSALKRYVGGSDLCGPNVVIEPWRAALCGSCTSALAAAITTPFDVAQTRVMLANTPESRAKSTLGHLNDVYRSRGVAGLFAGVLPRSMWMGIGGLVFLGSYEQARLLFDGSVDIDASLFTRR